MNAASRRAFRGRYVGIFRNVYDIVSHGGIHYSHLEVLVAAAIADPEGYLAQHRLRYS